MKISKEIPFHFQWDCVMLVMNTKETVSLS